MIVKIFQKIYEQAGFIVSYESIIRVTDDDLAVIQYNSTEGSSQLQRLTTQHNRENKLNLYFVETLLTHL